MVRTKTPPFTNPITGAELLIKSHRRVKTKMISLQTTIVSRAIMNALPYKQKEVLQTLLSLIDPLGKEKGCITCSIFCDIEDENVFNLISEWETRQQLDRYMRSHSFSVLLGTKSLLCEPLKIQILTVLDSGGKEAVNFIRKTNFPRLQP
jgi:quinol monooxygenase YgiN